MADSKDDSGVSSGGDHVWSRMLSWRKKKKEYKKQLFETISRLTSTLDNQTVLMKEMTSENRFCLAEMAEIRAQTAQLSENTTTRVAESDRQLQASATRTSVLEVRHEALQATLREKNALILERDDTISQLKDNIHKEQSEKIDLEQKYKALQETMYRVRTRLHVMEHKYGTENEMLRFDVVMLTKSLKKKIEELEKLNLDKTSILSYYRKQMDRFPWFYRRHFNHHTHAEEINSEAVERVTQQNKIIELENELYRKIQLIEELIRIIQEHDPDFKLHNHPDLLCFSDKQEFAPPGQPSTSSHDLHDPEVLTDDPVVMTMSHGFYNKIEEISNGINMQVIHVTNNDNDSDTT